MARLPASRIKKLDDPVLRDIAVGETVFISPFDLVADPEATCFLNPAARFTREKGTMHSLRVSRAADGFHASILGPDTWRFQELSPEVARSWIAVASVVEDLDPELDPDVRLQDFTRVAEDIRRLEGIATSSRLSIPDPSEPKDSE